MIRRVTKPQIVSTYFENSNIIYKGNQSIKYELRSEKYWITVDGYSGLVTTLFNITVTDA